MNNAIFINVSYGTFIVTKQNNNSDMGVMVSDSNNKFICTLHTYWWDKDSIINYLETNKKLMLK